MQKQWPGRSMGLVFGGLVLWLLDTVLNPLPLAAGTAFAGGCLGFLARELRPLRVIAPLSLAGAATGWFIHQGWHLSGASPAPAEGLGLHLLLETLAGLALALASLGLAWFISRRFQNGRN